MDKGKHISQAQDNPSTDLYGTVYGNFATQLMQQVRRETYHEDFGQSSWITADEYQRFFNLLELKATDHVLDIGSGSGGPALFLAREVGCRVTGVDNNETGVRAGQALIRDAGLNHRVHLETFDVIKRLPFAEGTFDTIVCMDVICHLPDRGRLFADWHRVLRSGGRLLYTDPVVVTGLVSQEEFAERSSTGYFEFGPVGVNERCLQAAGFDLKLVEDVTENEALVSGRWYEARQRRTEELIQLEGKYQFASVQQFLATVHRLTAEKRLSRYVYLSLKH